MGADYLHAQTESAAFYSQAGFTGSGESFMEAGIPHIEMRRQPAWVSGFAENQSCHRVNIDIIEWHPFR